MRILSWNINGVRTLPKYHPWNTFESFEGILDELKADIICFQEMKSARAGLPRDVALPGPYHSFFSFPVTKGGYSGVAVYVDSRKVTPHKAEEGLSGKLQPNSPLSPEERISPSYPYPYQMDLYPDEDGEVPSSFDALDAEGRGLVIDFGLFVLINVYCPNETSDARLSFKMNYHLMLQERVRKLIEEEHREVIVLGDINICATPMDHCDGHLPSNIATFYDHPARGWFHKWLAPNGPMIDIVRQYHPDRKGLYTCWNMKLQARETNYGTRVDYILVSKGLLPWISHGNIQPSLKGSDHCPIFIDLHDEITLQSGETLSLRDAMKQTPGFKEPPRLAAKFWNEFAGKQTVLSAFFGKHAALKQTDDTSPSSTPPPDPGPAVNRATSESVSSLNPALETVSPVSPATTQSASPPPPPEPLKKFKPPQTTRPSPAITAQKRKSSETASASTNSKKRKQQTSGQVSIASFFAKPTASSSSSSHKKASRPEAIEIDDDPPANSNTAETDRDQLDADYRLALALAEEASPPRTPSSSQSRSQSQKKAAWSSVFAPVPPPNCFVHNEPTRLYTVNKQGPNKGKKFYLCSRPVGPGYDKGKAERLRDEVDHQYRCDYFKWASEVRKEVMRERERERTKSGGS
ncbi:DNase I-like protein [Lentinus tigrinus ALCF2SS1-7]|uniref:DNA-(apurinic or apyrimidinic site) endonuclease n=1 Tax=Lentinus tigrinus ALCF2SS1-6 TaxID=1328759 RepID=A0A5C2SLJ6_9APHY|nr:DNase I-like protein [Lentinus tigrinus ALCF2SS1-6]RPD76229.1 DNase I-like protein [Lentinus tigrinus ALCF2SS1-7]